MVIFEHGQAEIFAETHKIQQKERWILCSKLSEKSVKKKL